HPWTPPLQTLVEDIPHVVTVHDPAAHPGFFHTASNLWETVSAVRAARCIVLGRKFVDEMAARGVARDRIDVIPLAALSFYEQFAQPAQVSNASGSLLFFGRITAYKGLHILIEAFRKLQKGRPDLRLNIVGEGDFEPYRKLVSDLANVSVVNRWVDDAEV